MRLKKIAALCKSKGILRLYDVEYPSGSMQQWAGTGYSVYPIEGVPYLEIEQLALLMELKDKDRERMSMSSAAPPALDFQDMTDEEIALDLRNEAIIDEGVFYQIFSNGRKSFLVDRDLLTPITAEYKTDILGFALRGKYNIEDGFYIPYIAVKAGLMLVGIVLPIVPTAEKMDRFAKLLSSIRTAEDDHGQM